jgi:hypothetical protein
MPPACAFHHHHRSTHVDSIYTINCCEFDSAPPKRSCRIEDYDRLAEIAEQYSQL